jgi:COP9 signalosome complex subunit 7
VQPFIALTKSATSPRAAADLVTRATSQPGIFLFTELLDTPQIQALANEEQYAPHLTLLKIFSYGSYSDYKKSSGLPSLNSAQATKLRQLSFLTLARDKTALTYTALQDALDIPDSRTLEDLVISTVYAGLINAVLDPAQNSVRISNVAMLRDVAPGSIPEMLRVLGQWSLRLDAVLGDLEAQVEEIRRAARERAAEKQQREGLMTKLTEEEEAGGTGLSELGQHGRGRRTNMAARQKHAIAGAGVAEHGGISRYGKRGVGHLDTNDDAADDEAMDVDDEDEEDEGKKRTSRRKL